MKKQIKKVLSCILIGIMLFSGTSVLSALGNVTEKNESKETINESSNSSLLGYSDYYASIKNIADAKNDIIVDYNNLEKNSTAAILKEELYGVRNSIAFSNIDDRAIFSFDVIENGKYNLLFDYAGIQGTSMNIQIEVYVDGKLLFDDMKELELLRWWKNSSDKWLVDRDGNEVTSEQIESFNFRKQYAYDSSGIEKNYFEIALTKGKHIIEIVSVQEPFALKNVVFKKINSLKSNKEILS